MTTRSSFMERFGLHVRTQDVDRVSSGSPVMLHLTHSPAVNTPAAARILLKRHVRLKTAHAALTGMLEKGEVSILVPLVEDVAKLRDELLAIGVVANVHPSMGVEEPEAGQATETPESSSPVL